MKAPNRRTSLGWVLFFVTSTSVSTTLPALCEERLMRWDRLPFAQQRPIDDLDHPRYRNRMSRLGWEVRTDRFVVLARSNRHTAERTLEQLESAWNEIAGLADRWTTVHRDPRMAIAPIFTYVDDEPHWQRPRVNSAMELSDYSSLYFNISDGRPNLEEQLDDVRRAAVRSFLQMTQMNHQLPAWVQDGLVEYVGSIRYSKENADNSGLKNQSRSASFRKGGSQHHHLALVHYLLEGNDASHAPAFFASMERTLETTRLKPNLVSNFTRYQDQRDQLMSHSWPIMSPHATPIDRLADSPKIVRGFAEWSHDTRVGQPLFDPDPGISESLRTRQREMILLLKLARRYPQNLGLSTVPVTTKWKEWSNEKSATTTTERLVYLNNLYVHLLDRAKPDWATIDINGRLLLSTDRPRVKQLVEQSRRFRGILRNDVLVLIDRWDGNTTIEVWLEENTENLQRPIARMQLVSTRNEKRPGLKTKK